MTGVKSTLAGDSSELTEILNQIKLPKFYKVRQNFDRTHIPRGEIPEIIKSKCSFYFSDKKIHPGMTVALTAGSRGVANIDIIIRALVEFFQARQAKPFIIPAMGSHGGATAQGQKEILEGYGITEEAMGCPVISSMEVTAVGRTADGRQVFIDKAAAEADGIVVIGRIKPHTAFRGAYQSGIMKMMAIGLGKQYGAGICHEEGFQRMAYNVEAFGKAVIKHTNILCALGIIENAFDQTFKIEVMDSSEIVFKEPKLLKEAERHMPRIQLPECDVLIVDEIGKNFSGDGMDPNVTGSFATPYAKGGIRAERICILDLSPETHGNGMGTGMASAVTEKVFRQLDLNAMYLNGLTCRNLNGSRVPCILSSDRAAILFCLRSCVKADMIHPKIVRIFNSQFVEYLWVSEALAERLPETIEILGAPEYFSFDKNGNLTDKEPRQRGNRKFK